jgi:hypothetical protein
VRSHAHGAPGVGSIARARPFFQANARVPRAVRALLKRRPALALARPA